MTYGGIKNKCLIYKKCVSLRKNLPRQLDKHVVSEREGGENLPRASQVSPFGVCPSTESN